MDGMLSQEEIDALTGAAGATTTTAAPLTCGLTGWCWWT